MPRFQPNPIPFSRLIFRPYAVKPLKQFPARPVFGIDTETLNGYVRLIADSSGKYQCVSSAEDVLSFLAEKRFRGAIGFFWNISYDFDAIVKWLPEDVLFSLIEDGKVSFDKFTLKYIPRKMFTLAYSKHKTAFYDLWQFYEMSLDNAAARYLGERKLLDLIDREQLGYDRQYWTLHQPDIIKYCIHDAFLTRQLGSILSDEVTSALGISPKAYVSKAGLAKQYFRAYADIPDIRGIPRRALKFAFNAYHGGRFEVTERGAVGWCTGIDITSAYPYEIANLIDISRGEWREVTEMQENAYYGFYAARVSLPYRWLPPLAFKFLGLTLFPFGEWSAFFTRAEIEAIAPFADITVYRGWEFYPDEIVYPFREQINTLYARKQGTNKGEFTYSLYKILMNSLYGCFYEKWRQTDGKYRTGLLFNPIYATLITSNTRLKLWKEANRYRKRAVCLATDGILIKGDVSAPETGELGDFTLDTSGEAVILRSGIYALGDKCRQRGVMKSKQLMTPYGSFSSIFDYITGQPDLTAYPVLMKRPVHLKEALKHHKKYTKEDINLFLETSYSFDLNSEIKRIFPKKNLTGNDLLHSVVKSEPYLADRLVKRLTKGGRGRG